VACAAGIATLDIYRETAILEQVRQDTAHHWRNRWGSLIDHPIVGEARTQGLFGALELVRDKASRQRIDADHRAAVHCRNAAIDNGLMVRQVGDAIISAPPLIISREEIDLLIDRLSIALDTTARHYGLNS